MPPHQRPDEAAVKSDNNVMAPMTSDYNQLNQSQSTVWRIAQPLFAKAMKDLLATRTTCATTDASTRSSVFRVADLGCATGGNSVAPLNFVSRQLLLLLENNADEQTCALEVFLGDLPQNDWSSVVSTVTPESITQDHARSAEETYVYMVGRTFYEACAPPESLDLSYSLVAVHWMKSYAGDLPSGLYATDSLHVPQPDLLKAWKDAGAQDFLDFTTARHRELKVGGRFIGAVACPKKNGHMPWSRVGFLLYQALASKEEIPKETLGSCVLPCCWRTEADVRAGFLQESGGWELEVCEFNETKDPVREQLERQELTPKEYGRAVIDSFAAVGHQTCVETLSSKSPSSTKVEQLLQEAYQDCVEQIGADPDKYNLDVSFWYVVAKKTK